MKARVRRLEHDHDERPRLSVEDAREILLATCEAVGADADDVERWLREERSEAIRTAWQCSIWPGGVAGWLAMKARQRRDEEAAVRAADEKLKDIFGVDCSNLSLEQIRGLQAAIEAEQA